MLTLNWPLTAGDTVTLQTEREAHTETERISSVREAKSETRGRGGATGETACETTGRSRERETQRDRERETQRERAHGRETGGGLTSLWRARPAPTAAILSQRPPFSSEREDGRERKSQQHRQRRTTPRGPTATRSGCLSVCLSDCLYLDVSLSPRRTRGRFWDVITAPLLPTRPFLCLSVCLSRSACTSYRTMPHSRSWRRVVPIIPLRTSPVPSFDAAIVCCELARGDLGKKVTTAGHDRCD